MEGPCAHPCPFTGSSDGVALDVLYWRASKQRNDPLKDFFPGLVWKCARPHVCAHLPESERSLLGLYVLVMLCVSRVTQQSGGIQPPPQHLAHRHLIKACFSEYLELSECPVYIEHCLLLWGTRIPAAFVPACRMSCRSLQSNLSWRERHIRDFC